MTILGSAIPIITAALTTAFDEVLEDVTVLNGQWTTIPAGTYLTVGWTPELEGPTATQRFPAANSFKRDEFFDIPCYVDALTGYTKVADAIATTFDVLAGVAQILQTDPSLGDAIPQPGWAQLGSYGLRQEQSDAGLAVGLVFHITGQARI